MLFNGWLDPALAARLLFALLLAAVSPDLVRTFHLAHRGRQARAPGFWRRGRPVDYARAVADGALLALIASLACSKLARNHA